MTPLNFEELIKASKRRKRKQAAQRAVGRKQAKQAKAPSGFMPIPKSAKGGFRKMQGGKWTYWYPGDAPDTSRSEHRDDDHKADHKVALGDAVNTAEASIKEVSGILGKIKAGHNISVTAVSSAFKKHHHAIDQVGEALHTLHMVAETGSGIMQNAAHAIMHTLPHAAMMAMGGADEGGERLEGELSDGGGDTPHMTFKALAPAYQGKGKRTGTPGNYQYQYVEDKKPKKPGNDDLAEENSRAFDEKANTKKASAVEMTPDLTQRAKTGDITEAERRALLFSDRTFLTAKLGDTIGVHLNLGHKIRIHKTKTWSVKPAKGKSIGGKTVGHVHSTVVKGAKLFVGEAGQAKVAETGEKTVHALVIGTMASNTTEKGVLSPEDALADKGTVAIRYNPHPPANMKWFMRENTDTGEWNIPVVAAEEVLFTDGWKVFAKGVTDMATDEASKYV